MNDSRPQLLGFVFFVWRMFNELHNQRQYSMDVLPLSPSDIIRVLEMHEITGEEKLDMYGLICKMDQAYLTHYIGKKPKKKGRK